MPPRQRGRVPLGDDWGVAGLSVSQPRTRSSAQAVSAVDSDEAMNSFAQRGYDQMPKQRGYGQMPMQQEFMPEFDEMYVSLDGMSERFANLAFNATDETQASAARDAFESLPIEAQRAACIMADYDVLATELGATSPQAKFAREAYAAAVFDADNISRRAA